MSAPRCNFKVITSHRKPTGSQPVGFVLRADAPAASLSLTVRDPSEVLLSTRPAQQMNQRSGGGIAVEPATGIRIGRPQQRYQNAERQRRRRQTPDGGGVMPTRPRAGPEEHQRQE